MVSLDAFPTEQHNDATRQIDCVSIPDALRLINAQDRLVADAVQQAIPAIASLVAATVPVLADGGSLVYVGAGTSGRLGVLDAAECPPTFSALPWQVQAIIAGGDRAMTQAVEGAEDDGNAGEAAIQAVLATATVKPVVVGLSASGAAAFVQRALAVAKQAGCITGCITCHPGSPLVATVDHPVVVTVGPEAVTGSTRMKAGTAQKMVLNMLSTTCMIQLGKTYGNWMVDVRPTNRKLRQRAIRIVAQLGRVEPLQAEALLAQADWQVKPAVVMARFQCGLADAQARLSQHGQKLRLVLGD